MKNLIKNVSTNVNTTAKLLASKWNELDNADKAFALATATHFGQNVTLRICKYVDEQYIVPAIAKRSPKLASGYAKLVKVAYPIAFAKVGVCQVYSCVEYMKNLDESKVKQIAE